MLKNKELIFNPNDLYIASTNSLIGNNYFLLYKNYQTRIEANKYCDKYINFLDNCLIVNVQNLD